MLPWDNSKAMPPNYYIFCGVAVTVTLVAMWAGQSRLHWFWRGCILEEVLALFLPVKAHEPLLFFLLATPLIAGGVAWLESRRPRTPVDPGNESPPPPKKRRQLSLAEAFLLLGLIGGACGLGSAAVRGGVLMDWRSLPVSALVFTSVALLCYRIGAFPGGVPHYWALSLTGLVGGGVLLWFGIQSLQVILPSHATPRMALVSVWAVCLLLAGGCYFLLRFGNPRHIVALGGLIGTILCSAIYYMAFSASAAIWKKWLARIAALGIAATSIYSLAGIYWSMLATTPFPATSFVKSGENPLENAVPLLDEFYALSDTGGFDPRNFPKAPRRHLKGERVSELYNELVQELQKPGWASFDPSSGPESRVRQGVILQKLIGLNNLFEEDFAHAEEQQDYAAALPYAMAEIQLYANLEHEGLMMHRSAGGTVLRLGAIRNHISLSDARQALATLRRIEREYEDLAVTMQREQAWEEQSLNWRGRLGRLSNRGIWIVYGGRGYSERAFKDNDQTKHTWFRLLMAELALRLYYEEHGRYPERLEELVPTYLDSVPIDPFSGQPLVYRVHDEKYHLSSVWANHIDDQGKDQDLDTCIEVYQRSVAKAVAATAAAAKAPAKTSAPQPASGSE
jgi:hypothetical protein